MAKPTVLRLFLVLVFVNNASAQQQKVDGDQLNRLGPNVQVVDLEEFTVTEEAVGHLTGSPFFFGQSSMTSWDPGKQVKKYPQLHSEKPIYGVFSIDQGVFPSGSIDLCYCFVIDESKGTGIGYDRFYIDTNHDFDLSNDLPVKATLSVQDEHKEQATQTQNVQDNPEIIFKNVTIKYYPDQNRRVDQNPDSKEIKCNAVLDIFQDILVNVTFKAATAYRGKIKIGNRHIDVHLGYMHSVTSSFDHPNTGLHLDIPRDKNYGYGVLGKMRNIDGKLYRFSALPNGSKLFMTAYQGEYGTLEIGAMADKLKSVGIEQGELLSRDTLIDIKDCPTKDAKVKIPVGDYRIKLLHIVTDNIGMQLVEENRQDNAPYCLRIDAGKPFVFNTSYKLTADFISPEKTARLKPGESLTVSALLNLADLNLKLIHTEDRYKSYKLGTNPDGSDFLRYDPFNPDIQITDSSGKVVAEGKMPFG